MRDRERTAFSAEQMEEQVLLEKQWSKNKISEHRSEMILKNRVLYAQQKALRKLREESEELYQQAIQVICRLSSLCPGQGITKVKGGIKRIISTSYTGASSIMRVLAERSLIGTYLYS